MQETLANKVASKNREKTAELKYAASHKKSATLKNKLSYT
jgi:hypothetical protein